MLDLAGLPPALVVLSGVDPVLDDGLAYADRLRAAGVPVTIDRHDGVFHGFLMFAPALDEATAAQDRIATELRARVEGVLELPLHWLPPVMHPQRKHAVFMPK